MGDTTNRDLQIEWDKMTPEERSKLASRQGTFKIWTITIAALLLAGQPLLSDYYKDRNATRDAEIRLNEKRAESALEMAKAAITEVTHLSSRQGELMAENEILRQQSAELKESFDKLKEKYTQLEQAYQAAIEEKKLLELRIDEFFKNQKNAPPN